MNEGLGDLLQLFLEEARDRLLHLNAALVKPQPGDDDLRIARRELHALKGASRMLGLHDLSELCHRAEESLESPNPASIDEACRTVIELAARVESLVDSPQTPRDPEPLSDRGVPHRRRDGDAGVRRSAADRRSLRVAHSVLDGMSDAASGVRVHTEAGLAALDKVSRVSEIAAAGAAGGDPHQVLAAVAATLRRHTGELGTSLREIRRLGRDQADTLLRLQLHSIRPFLNRMAEHAKEISEKMGKRIEVKVSAAEARLDRRIAGALEEGFLHLVRNAVDHGIEDPAERAASGKPECGRLEMRAVGEGDRARISVSDDGRGLDTRIIAEVAVRRGVVSADEIREMSEVELQQLIFRPGFSTRDTATEISGRGVGLDAVAGAVHSVGGDIAISTTLGGGTRVDIEVPVTRRAERILVVRIVDTVVGIPASSVRAYSRLDATHIAARGSRTTVRCGSQMVALARLDLGPGSYPGAGDIVVCLAAAGSHLALVIDAVLGEEEVLARPLPAAAGVSGAFESMAVLASGRPVPIVSMRDLRHATAVADAPGAARDSWHQARVLLVDDSRVTREMLRRLLLDAGFDVTAVASVAGALDNLVDRGIDCVVTDIEMPGRDGLELTRRIREDQGTAQLPVIVISTRSRPEDRLAGLEAGADAYLTKQNLDADELVALIRRFGGETRG
jgi:two-component system chemotaxis sensor kinase CheA